MNIIFLLVFSNLQVDHLASHFVQGQYFEVKIVDTLAYFASGWGLEIYNISDPATPQLLGQESTNGYASGLDVAGDYVYIADMYNGLTIFNATNITDPVVCGRYATNGFVEDVAVNQNFAYLADDTRGLIILDVSDPTNPIFLGSYDTGAVLYSVRVVDTIAYLGSNNKPLQIVSVADPANPYLICEFPFQDGGFIEAAYVVDTIAFLAGTWYFGNQNYNFLIANIADPANPSFIAGLDFDDIGTDVVVQDNYAYVNAEQAGVRIINISNLALPVEAGYFNEAVIASYSSAIKDSILLVPEHNQGFSVVNVKNPARPIKLAHRQSMSYSDFEFYNSQRFSLVCNLISKTSNYLLDYYTSLKFVDAHDMMHPSVFSELNFLGSVFYATPLSCDYPHVALGISRHPDYYVAIIECSNPSNPQLAKYEWVMNSPGRAVSQSNSLTYVSSSNKLYIGDINLTPFLIDSIDTPSPVFAITFADSLAYCACQDYLITINLNQSSIISTYYHSHAVAGANNGIVMDSTYLYISYWDFDIDQSYYGFMIFDISNASAPGIIIDTMAPDSTYPPTWAFISGRSSCCLADSLFFLNCGLGGYEIWNVKDPAHPTRLLVQETPAICTNIRVINDTITAMTNLSIEIYSLTETGIAESDGSGAFCNNSVLRVSPNPFFRKTEITYCPQSVNNSAKSLRIFNAAGQLVRNFLLPATYSALSQTIIWDGTDNSGLILPQGVYFIEIIVEKQSYVKKVVLLR